MVEELQLQIIDCRSQIERVDYFLVVRTKLRRYVQDVAKGLSCGDPGLMVLFSESDHRHGTVLALQRTKPVERKP